MGGLNTLGGSRYVLAGMGLAFALLSTVPHAEARGRHRNHQRHYAHRTSSPGGTTSSPAFAALVVDANSGRALYSVNPNELRHPASITKVMTLYLLFEKLQKGDMTLQTQITVSRHAASQSPTKLGLRPGATISVENAIKAIVTRSANDMAVAVGEAIGGDEDTFARMMTRKAHSLGMSRTVYVNASGLPDNRQITTAHDLVLLGRAIQDRFPNYYRFFSTPSFTYAGQVITNHNHLMSRIEGMDGIKTGYTNASGFNLLSNVNRDGHHIVAVVMGGRSAAGRDNIMAGLIGQYIEEAAPTRTAGVIEERPTEPAAETVQEVQDADDQDAHDTSPTPSLIAPTMAVPPVPARPARQVARAEKPRPAFVAGASRIETDRLPGPLSQADRRRIAADGSTSSRSTQSESPALALATSTPSSLRWVTGPAPARMGDAAPVKVAATVASSETNQEANTSRESASGPKPAHVADSGRGTSDDGHGNWGIQIGATDSPHAASDLLARARTQGRGTLSAARPVTERVQKGNSTLYRARFAGLGPEQAEAACKTLKRSGFACFATRD